MPVSAQTISTLATALTGAAQAVSADAAPALESSSADSRWRRFESINGTVSCIDRQSVKPQPGATVDANSHVMHFRLLRNVLPDSMIKAADGQSIRLSVKQVVFDCARHSYIVITQALYRARNATGKSLCQIHYSNETQSCLLREGNVLEWIAGRSCGAGR